MRFSFSSSNETRWDDTAVGPLENKPKKDVIAVVMDAVVS